MALSVIGAALRYPDLEGLRDWLFDHDRPVEIQDFVHPDVLDGDTAPLVAAWNTALEGHHGARGLHGPFFGLDLSNPDRDIRAVIQRRLLQGLDLAAALSATHMVVHSPFTYWHSLNFANYTSLRDEMFSAAMDCLAPVLRRAAETGCVLTLENIDDADPALRGDLVKAIGDPHLLVSLDTGHAELAHGRYAAPPVVDYISAAGDLLGHVHLQDADGYADRHWHPFDGRIAWAPCFDAIAALKAQPRLILEVRNNLHRLPETARRLAALGV